jgi:hypothetical protein
MMLNCIICDVYGLMNRFAINNLAVKQSDRPTGGPIESVGAMTGRSKGQSIIQNLLESAISIQMAYWNQISAIDSLERGASAVRVKSRRMTPCWERSLIGLIPLASTRAPARGG